MAAFSLITRKDPPRERERVRTNPYFLRLIFRTFWVFTAILCLIAAFFYEAPLGPPANRTSPPNPAKSAWFLLWIQELVSHSTLWAYPLLFGAMIAWFLPELLKSPTNPSAAWFKRDDAPVWVLVIIGIACILTLTAYAAIFRGENWQSSFPWPF